MIETVFVTGGKIQDKIEELKVETSGGAKRQRQDKGGRHLTSEKTDENLLECIFDICSKGLYVSRKIIMVKPVKFQEEKEKEDLNITKMTFS